MLFLNRFIVLGTFLGTLLVAATVTTGNASDQKVMTLHVSADGPLKTIEGARDRIRKIKEEQGGLKQPITVLIHEGRYSSAQPITFTPADSGTASCPITYQAAPGERVILSGGVPLSGWEVDDSRQSKEKCQGKLWRLDLAKATGRKPWNFNQLYVNGQPRTRARTTNPGSFLRLDGPVSKKNHREFFFKEGDLNPKWKNLEDVLVVVYHSWETSLHHIRRIDTESHRVTLYERAPWELGRRWERQQRYYVENVFEALDQPGEWYLDRRTATLYYYPMPGEKINKIETIAPRLTPTLVQFQGDLKEKQYVEHLRFRGLSFQHTNAALGYLRNPNQGEISQKALIMAVGLRNSVIEQCEVTNTGVHAIWMGSGCEDNLIRQCHLHHLGGGGVYIGGGGGFQEAAPTQRITVDNCFIHEGGLLFHGAHGVWVGKSSYNNVTHNEISNFDYTGISCGWSWDFSPSSANHNHLDNNHIHHLSNGEGLSDMGGIYTLGISPGTTMRYNHIHDVYSYAYISDGSGLYTDQGSSEILAENNIVHHVRSYPIFQHFGRNNTFRNNILAMGEKGLLFRAREDEPCNFTIKGNLFYNDNPELIGGVWKNGDWTIGDNVYWSTDGTPRFAGMDFDAWKKAANDTGSIVADPRFVDPDNSDFRLKPDSPALKLGFKPIDTNKIGLYGDPAWVNLPQKYPNRKRNDVPPPDMQNKFIHFDFEAEEPGGEPMEGKVMLCKQGSSVEVTEETAAAGGKRSLKFTDAPGQIHNWKPHLCYYKTCAEGNVLCSWDMLNSKDRPADFSISLRNFAKTKAKSLGHTYQTGPIVKVSPEGNVTANGQVIATIPLGQWVHVEISMTLGKNAPKDNTYQLTLTIPGRDPITIRRPYANQEFRQVDWLGFSSHSTDKAEFYLDNIKLGTPEELAKAPVRCAPAPREWKKPKPGEDPNLLGHWKFEGTNLYMAEDSSGYGNDGDLWARRAAGKFGRALVCTETESCITVEDNPSLHLGNSDFSLELWLCPTDLQGQMHRILQKNSYPETWIVMDITPRGQIVFQMVDDQKKACPTRTKNVVPEKAWTHLAVTVDRTNGEVRWYLDGKLDSVHPIPSTFTGSLDIRGKDLTIGSNWHPFLGLLDEVKLHKRTLTPDEIRASYKKEKPNRTSVEYKPTKS